MNAVSVIMVCNDWFNSTSYRKIKSTLTILGVQEISTVVVSNI